MSRLKKAMNSGFYLEALFIEYSIMEDRLESILRHAGKWKEPESGKFVSISAKINKITKMAEEKKVIAHKYFSNTDLFARITEWVYKRNKLIHALMKQQLHTIDLQNLADEGIALIRELDNKAKSFTRTIEKQYHRTQNE